ncbi:MAG: UTP--glucose-1-phosphate uridylyltransferase [Deltaproteobacteria bacterium]|nr:UTP--glucose-1-phosphate uridylyltransferase [Deltaproteobacteria bacterium]MBW2338862.1 UTP--glucose-1-phosphate uridylyltransferase [Deltaproteobacteria bacterium]
MSDEGIPPLIIDTFKFYYGKLLSGERGFISRDDIVPVGKDEIADLETLNRFTEEGVRALKEAVIIKLNGGLGTSMGLSRAKSLIEVKDGYNFLDIIARQVLSLRKEHETDIPLVLMNSFSTDEDSTKFLERYPELGSDIPLSFLQNKFPKVLKQDLSPAVWPLDPDLEWNPPGHGDIYCALITSGMLDKLIMRGYQYAFISNSDNLGGTMNVAALGYLVSNDFPFMMEVAEKTKADTKGGHIARLRQTGGLVLREIAQCPEEEIGEFQDIEVYKYFNTNNIWVNLVFLKDQLKEPGNIFKLPVIVNPKRISSRDDSSPEVYQIETAMGSAISIFERSAAVKVPKTRFAPVKRCQDLVALMSDCYVMTEDSGVIQNPQRRLGDIEIDLDDRYYRKIDQLQERFPHGVPSLVDCKSFKVEGNVYFGRGIVIKGDVTITNPLSERVSIPEGAVIDKDLLFDKNLT